MTNRSYASTLTALILLSALPTAQGLTVENAINRLQTHQFGENSEVLDFLCDAAAKSQTDSVLRDALNQGFADILESDASYASKQFVCRLLVFTATEKQIPLLATHLSDPQMSHMAMYALTHLKDPAVDRALINRLDKTSNHTQLGIITALGHRRCVEAVKSLSSLLDSDEQAVATEAALALGRIGTGPCASLLISLANTYPQALPGKIADALLECADRQASTDPETAQTLYRRMLDKRQAIAIRCAALNGLANLLGEDALPLLITTLKEDDAQVRNTAAHVARTLPGDNVAQTLAEALSSFAPQTQVLVIKVLGARAEGSALRGILAAASHTDLDVRVAALNALATVGDSTAIPLLALHSVNGSPAEQTGARNTLVVLAGSDINPAMAAQLTHVTPAQQVVLIETLAKRQAFETAPALLSLTQSDIPALRRASLTTLGAIGSEDQMAELLRQLVHEPTQRDLTGRIVTQIAVRTGQTERASGLLMKALKSANAAPLRTTLLFTLGQIKHDSALPILKGALNDADSTIQYNTIKALSSWPNVSPASALLAVAKTSPVETHRILALRGHIDLVASSDLSGPQKHDHYEQAMALATLTEKKRILARLPELNTVQALDLATQCLADPATATEAAQAAVTLAQQIADQSPDAATDGMLKVIESVASDSFKQKAQQILQQLSLAEDNRVPATYQALERRTVVQGKPWAILERDGANRSVKAYLSSLAQGETATGVIASPPFVVAGSKITFTLCGHDGQGGGRGENFMALVHDKTGEILKKTAPPGNDAMRTFTWDVGQLRGTEVRFEVHDGNPGTAYAWLGVGSIEASPAFRIDFSEGLPTGWTHPEPAAMRTIDLVTEGVPFRQTLDQAGLLGTQGSAEFACGFAANRLFFLGMTVDSRETAACYGGIEIHYQTGSPEVFPLICGHTLNALPLPSNQPKATHLYETDIPGQFTLAIQPRQAVIEKIRLVADPKGHIPSITAITCETTMAHERLVPLAGQAIPSAEANWIDTHTISAASPDLNTVLQILNARASKEASPVKFTKHCIDRSFRSEGVAVADFNGDGHLDIATGNLYYAGPDWTPVPILGKTVTYNRHGYSDAFLCFAEDVDANGDMDLIVVGFPGQQTHWLENPGQAGKQWRRHLVTMQTGNESPMYRDVTGDGRRELVFMHQGRCVMARPGQDPRTAWPITPISNPGDPAPGHGLGAGDINGDGRVDVLVPDGWWEAPSGASASAWPFHRANLFGEAQLCVYDFDGDQDADVLGSAAHGYGIAWSEQTSDGWRTHQIDSADSQTHAIHLADLDADGLMDFVTGKRFWAHNGHDPGSFQPAVLCWYEQQREAGRVRWVKHIIDFDTGVGLHFQVIDLNGDDRLDIVLSNKKGVHVFVQR